MEYYPFPKVENLFPTLAGGVLFTKLDMSQPYLQLALDDQAKELLTINTHKGLFAYDRLPFRVLSAPGIFQCTMESFLSGIPNVLVYLDDILVTGHTQEQHVIATFMKFYCISVTNCFTLNKAKVSISSQIS